MEAAYNELEIGMDPADRCNAFSPLSPLNGRELGCSAVRSGVPAMLRKRLAMWGCGVVRERNKPTGPTCFRHDDRGEGHWLREEQPGGLSNQGQVCGGAWRDRGSGGANITQREREAILRERLKEMAGEREEKGKGLSCSCRWLLLREGQWRFFRAQPTVMGFIMLPSGSQTHMPSAPSLCYYESIHTLEAWEGTQYCLIAPRSSGPGNALADGSREGPDLQIEPPKPSAVIPPAPPTTTTT